MCSVGFKSQLISDLHLKTNAEVRSQYIGYLHYKVLVQFYQNMKHYRDKTFILRATLNIIK